AAIAAGAQARPDLNGSWGPYRGGRGADPKLAAVPFNGASVVLKEPYAKPYAERRAATTAATQRGEPGPTNGMLCVPYGFPTMMSVAVYPVEVIQTPKPVTIVTEAFSEVRRIFWDKPQMKIDDVPPGYYGRSVGK